MIVESVSGTSDFTLDPQRHNILENTIQVPQDTRPTGVLPDRKTADVLIDSFFTNVGTYFTYVVVQPNLPNCRRRGLSKCLIRMTFSSR